MNDAGFGQPWYAKDGPLSPVVLTTRVRLARNVEDAVFPLRIKSGDAERILSGVFRIFAEEEAYRSLQGIRLSDLDPLDRRMLYERGVLDASCGQESWRGLLFSEDGDLSVSVNVEDHVRISVFAPGLSAVQAFSRADAVDSFLQKKMNFCAKPQYGYLTSSIDDMGTGMKVSAVVFLPGLSLSGLCERVVRECLASGFLVRGYYGSSGERQSMGWLYQISRTAAFDENPDSQLASLKAVVERIVEMENRARGDLVRNRRLYLEDMAFRALAAVKYARFLDLHEVVDLLMKIKMAIEPGLITGVSQSAITALIYRIRPAHIEFLLQNGSLHPEPEITAGADAVNRARAMVVQEVLKNADIDEGGR